MKKILLVIPLIGLLFSCNLFNTIAKKEKNTDHEILLKSALVEFKKSKKIYAFELNPLDTMASERICSYAIKKELNRLSKYYKNVMEFLLSDSTLYEANYIPIKQPFYPTLAFKPNKKNNVSCMLSFGTEEIAFSNNDSTYTTYRLNNINSFKRLRDEILYMDSLNRE